MTEDVSAPIVIQSERDAAVRALLAGLTTFESVQTLLESLPVGVMLADAHGRIVAVNSIARR